MTSIDRFVRPPSDSRTRIIFTAGDDPAVIEAAYMAAKQERVTPMLIGSEERAHEVAARIPTDDLIFLDFIDLVVESTPPVELASLLVREGVAHGALFGSDVDLLEASEELGEGAPLSASVFLELPSGSVIVFTAALDGESTEHARLQVEELIDPEVRTRRLADGDIERLRRDPRAADLMLCDATDLDFGDGGPLHSFGAADAYGPLLFGSSIPAAFLRPHATVDDVLGSLALLTALVGPLPEAIDVSDTDRGRVEHEPAEKRSLFLPPE